MVETVLENNCETITNSTISNREPKSSQNGNSDHYNPSVRELNIPKLSSGACGFDLSRSKWDPYPWVSHFSFVCRSIIQSRKYLFGKFEKIVRTNVSFDYYFIRLVL